MICYHGRQISENLIDSLHSGSKGLCNQARAAGKNHVRQHEALIGGVGGADQMDIVVVDILLVLSNTQAGPTDQV